MHMESDSRVRFVTPYAAVLLALAAGTVAGQPIYRVRDVGTLGGPYSRPTWLSDAGHVVGEADTTEFDRSGNRIRRAFLWYKGAIVDLGSFGEFGSNALSVNSAGQVVGYAHSTYDRTHPFLWLPEPAFGLPAGLNRLSFQGCDRGGALGINETGQVMGLLGNDVFLWLPGPMYGLPSGTNLLTNEDWCYLECGFCPPSGINELGQIAYANLLWLPEPAYGLPVGWTELWPFVFDDYHDACDINNAGTIVALNSQFAGSSIEVRELPTGEDYYIGGDCGCGLNDLGEALAGFALVQLVDGARWSGDIRTRVSPVFGWELQFCTAGINRAGMIAASARSKAGDRHAVLLEPIDFDVNHDAHHNLTDALALTACMLGPGVGVQLGCESGDLDLDGDVDLIDLHLMVWGYTSAP